MIILKSNHEIELMRKAGKITAKAHEAVKRNIKPGMSTLELDKIVEDVILSNNAGICHLLLSFRFPPLLMPAGPYMCRTAPP